MKDVKAMSDADLTALIEQADLVTAAREEIKRRRSNVVTEPTASIRITTDATCPSCGKRDAVLSTKTLYANDMLGKDGKPPVGTLAYCSCGARYNAGTGEHVGRAYTY